MGERPVTTSADDVTADHEDRIGMLERLVDELRARLAGLLGRGLRE